MAISRNGWLDVKYFGGLHQDTLTFYSEKLHICDHYCWEIYSSKLKLLAKIRSFYPSSAT